jgi:thioredoxin-like negative regulator of GroEL
VKWRSRLKDWSPDELQKYLDSGSNIFLKIWKKGCGACKLSIPATDRLEAENNYGLTFGQVSADDYPEILEITESEVLPVFFVFAKKQMIGRLEGFKGIDKLRSMIDEAFDEGS